MECYKAIKTTSIVIQLFRLCTPNAGGPGYIPSQGIRSQVLQLTK